MYIFLSPHFDDAIGSAGGVISRLITAGHQVRIMTIMARAPRWPIGKFIYVARRILENKRAARVLGVSVQNAPFFDAIYRRDNLGNRIYPKKSLFTAPIRDTNLVADIRDFILKNSDAKDIIFAPASLGGHIDHRAVRAATDGIKRQVYIYEEFFYDLNGVDSLTKNFKTILLTDAELSLKIKSLEKYNKTMKKLFGKNHIKKLRDYFLKFRISRDQGFEKFNETDFIK